MTPLVRKVRGACRTPDAWTVLGSIAEEGFVPPLISLVTKGARSCPRSHPVGSNIGT